MFMSNIFILRLDYRLHFKMSVVLMTSLTKIIEIVYIFSNYYLLQKFQLEGKLFNYKVLCIKKIFQSNLFG